MDCSSQKRPASALLVGLLLSAIILTVLVYAPGLIRWESRVASGIGRAALAGGTVGRQALTASAWYGLLPNLWVSVLAWLIPSGNGTLPWSALLAGALATGAALSLLRGFAGRRLGAFIAFCLVLTALCSPATLFAAGDAGAALAAALGIHALYCLSRWRKGRSMGYLVGGALFSAGVLLCGIETAGWMGMLLAAWIVSVLTRRSTARRLPGLALLMFLPSLYFLAVWMLLNSLIMGDAFFFLRFLTGVDWGRWQGWTRPELGPALRGAAMLSGVALARGLWRGEGETSMIGFGGLAAWGWLWIYESLGFDWAGRALGFILLLCGLFSAAGMARWWREKQPSLAGFWIMLPVLTAALHLWRAPILWRELHESDLSGERKKIADMEHFVLEKKPLARIFVGGYDALGLLGSDRRGRMQAVIDLHPDVLREDYWGQDLFVLLRRPRGKAEMDSLFIRFPNLYGEGLERALYAGDWGDWRLFEMILAPSAKREGLRE